MVCGPSKSDGIDLAFNTNRIYHNLHLSRWLVRYSWDSCLFWSSCICTCTFELGTWCATTSNRYAKLNDSSIGSCFFQLYFLDAWWRKYFKIGHYLMGYSSLALSVPTIWYGLRLGAFNISNDVEFIYLAGIAIVFITIVFTYITNTLEIQNVWTKRILLMFGPIFWVPLFSTVLYYILSAN